MLGGVQQAPITLDTMVISAAQCKAHRRVCCPGELSGLKHRDRGS